MRHSDTTATIRGLQWTAAVLTAAISVMSLIGWVTGDLRLAGRTLRYDAMVPATALVFLMLAAALAVRLRTPGPSARRLVLGAGIAVWVVVLLSIVDFLSGAPVALDRLFATTAQLTEGRMIGRMSPLVAVLFALLATAIMLHESSQVRRRRMAIVLALTVAGVGFTLMVGFAYDAPLLYDLAPYPPAAFAALGMFMMGLGIAALDLERRPFALFIGETVRAQLMRAILPAVAFTAFAFAVLGIADVRFGLAQGPLPTSVLLVAVVAGVTAIVLRSASRIGSRVDVAERERQSAENALRESEQSYREQFAANSVVMLLMDASDGRILDANAAAVEFYGYPIERFRELNIRDVSTLSEAEILRTFERIHDVGRARLELPHRLADGSLRDVEVASSLIRLGGRMVVHIIVQDVSKRKAAEAELKAQQENLEQLVEERTAALVSANEELQQATAAKSDFLASMSHELRTPLNSIIGFSDILYRGMAGDLTEEQERQIGMINRSGKHLLALINDVLDVAKIEAGKVELRIESVNAEEVVGDTLEIVRPMAEEKRLGLHLKVDGDDWEIRTDREKVRQILLNLLGNAVKFTDAGDVTVSLRRTEDGGVSVAVTDTGRGIAEQDQPRIFEAFTQIATPDLASPPGTGLGLSISREFAALLGGQIAVESVPGEGSTFTVTLPG